MKIIPTPHLLSELKSLKLEVFVIQSFISVVKFTCNLYNLVRFKKLTPQRKEQEDIKKKERIKK